MRRRDQEALSQRPRSATPRLRAAFRRNSGPTLTAVDPIYAAYKAARLGLRVSAHRRKARLQPLTQQQADALARELREIAPATWRITSVPLTDDRGLVIASKRTTEDFATTYPKPSYDDFETQLFGPEEAARDWCSDHGYEVVEFNRLATWVIAEQAPEE